MSILILVTGGTFDKEYNEINGELTFGSTNVPDMLRKGRCRIPVNVRTIMMVDSAFMTEEERELIAITCNEASEDRILITHGTDTMVKTARLLAGMNMNRTIVLTGAMIPYTFWSSDGFFNLGSALAFVQTLPHGVYVAMNGRYFTWDRVRKNREIGEFEEISPEDYTP